MVIKLKDPKRWMLLPMGDVIALEGEGRRPVRIEANAVTDAHCSLVYPDGASAFLAAFKGIETIEFVADGPVEVWVTSEGDVYFYTDDGRNVAFVDDGQVSFTKAHQRRSESEQIIYMQGLMLANMTRRNEQLEVYRAEQEALEAARANGSGLDTGELPADTGKPPVQSAPDAGTNGVVESNPAS